MKNFVLLLFSFVVGTVFYNCSATDDDPVRISGQWTFSTVATKDSGEVVDDADIATRGLFIGGSSGKRYVSLWDNTDEVKVYRAGEKSTEAFLGTLTPSTTDVATTDLSGVLSGTISEGETLDFYIPREDRDYTGQTGSLIDLTKYAYMSSQVRINKIDGTTVITDPVIFSSKEAYLRLRFTDSDGGLRLPVEQLVIHSASGQILLREPLVPTEEDPIVHGDLVINTVKENGGYPNEVYVCMHNDLGASDSYTFTIKSGGYYYVSAVLNYNFRDTKYVIASRKVTLQGPASRVTTTTTVDGFEDGGGDNDGNIKY